MSLRHVNPVGIAVRGHLDDDGVSDLRANRGQDIVRGRAETDHDQRLSRGCDDVGRQPSLDPADVDRRRPVERIKGQVGLHETRKRRNQIVDGGAPELRICAVRGLPLGPEHQRKDPFGAGRGLRMGGLTVDDPPCGGKKLGRRLGPPWSPSLPRRSLGARYVAHLAVRSCSAAHHIAAKIPFASQVPRPYRCVSSSEHGMNGGTVSRCVVNTTSGRFGCVRTRENVQPGKLRLDLPLRRNPLRPHVPALLGQPAHDMRRHSTLGIGDRRNVDELACQGDDIHGGRIERARRPV